MAETLALAKTAFTYVTKGQLPPTDLLKLLVSKASKRRRFPASVLRYDLTPVFLSIGPGLWDYSRLHSSQAASGIGAELSMHRWTSPNYVLQDLRPCRSSTLFEQAVQKA